MLEFFSNFIWLKIWLFENICLTLHQILIKTAYVR